MNPVTAAPETVSTSGSRTLVLNAGYEPLSVVSFRRALVLVMNGRAIMVEGDDAHPVRSVEGTWERPSVIVLTRYVKMPHNRHIPVSRRGVLRRDSHRCAYCGNSATTIDHVLPRSRGGIDAWENLVACCLKCNNIKGDRTPQEMGWMLLSEPKTPYGSAWLVRGIERPQPHWEGYLAAA
ncbi:MAG: HNH endonuclease [Microbacteriaceae bacterium]|nr:HNH endonuclease [Microbacteriaceae bacterium]